MVLVALALTLQEEAEEVCPTAMVEQVPQWPTPLVVMVAPV